MADPIGDDVEVVDATRRTHLANERTYLAWWRTGLTALAASLAVGRIVPEFAGGRRWPYEALGAAYAVLGIALLLYGSMRRREVDQALREGRFAPAHDHALTVISILAVAIGLVTGALIVITP
jgi:inner membrane protein YidH